MAFLINIVYIIFWHPIVLVISVITDSFSEILLVSNCIFICPENTEVKTVEVILSRGILVPEMSSFQPLRLYPWNKSVGFLGVNIFALFPQPGHKTDYRISDKKKIFRL